MTKEVEYVVKEYKVGNNKIVSKTPILTDKERRSRLENLYDTCNRLFPPDKYPNLYYTHEEVEGLKRDPKNTFI